MNRRRVARAVLAGALAAGAVLASAPVARSDDPPVVIPPPPVTAPSVAYPDALRPVLDAGAPITSYACGTYSSTTFTTDLVLGLVVPIIVKDATQQPSPVDLRPVALYLQLAAGGCAAIPPYESPTRCTTDDEMAARMTSLPRQTFSSIGQDTLANYVGLTLPTEGMIVDTVRSVEQFLRTSDDPADAALAAGLAEALDCRQVVEARRPRQPTPTGDRNPPSPAPVPSPSRAATPPSAGVGIRGDAALAPVAPDAALGAPEPGVAPGVVAPVVPAAVRTTEGELRPWMVALSAVLAALLAAAAVTSLWQPSDDDAATPSS